MIQTKMATATEVEGEPTVSVSPDIEAGLKQEEAQVEQKQTAPAMTEEVKTETQEETQGTEAGETPPTRKERRIGEFIDKLKEKDRETSALREELDRLKGTPSTPPQAGLQSQGFGTPPWDVPQVQPGSEVTPEQLNSYVAGAARNLTAVELNRFKGELAKLDNFKDDLRYVEGKYDILNPDKADRYDKVSSKKITELYMKAAKGDPTLRLKDFVDNIMSFRQEGRNEGMMEVTPKVLKNQGEGAIPPSSPGGRRSESVNPDDMSEKEMEQYLRDNDLWDK